ncbi:unnamed protein product [Cochlearia groenlandica]
MVIEEQDLNLRDYIRGYAMRPWRGFIHQQPGIIVFNDLLIKEEQPNAPPLQRDELLSSYMMKNTNSLYVGVGYTFSKFDINSNLSKTSTTILSTHEYVLTAMKEPHTHSYLSRTESPTQNHNYSPSSKTGRLIGATCEAQMSQTPSFKIEFHHILHSKRNLSRYISSPYQFGADHNRLSKFNYLLLAISEV